MIVLQILAGAAALTIALLVILGIAAAFGKDTAQKAGRLIGQLIAGAIVLFVVGAVVILGVLCAIYSVTGEWRLP